MIKCKHVEVDGAYPGTGILNNITGKVTSSDFWHEKLCLKIDNNETEFLIHDYHRIDIGEIIRIHYNRSGSSKYYYIVAYEILEKDKIKVKFRVMIELRHKYVEYDMIELRKFKLKNISNNS